MKKNFAIVNTITLFLVGAGLLFMNFSNFDLKDASTRLLESSMNQAFEVEETQLVNNQDSWDQAKKY